MSLIHLGSLQQKEFSVGLKIPNPLTRKLLLLAAFKRRGRYKKYKVQAAAASLTAARETNVEDAVSDALPADKQQQGFLPVQFWQKAQFRAGQRWIPTSPFTLTVNLELRLHD